MKYKLTLAIVTLFMSISTYSQSHEQTRIIDVLDDISIIKQFHYDAAKTSGSPYLNEKFMPAVVNSIGKNAIMRYDVYNDEFEFVNAKHDTLVLNKDKKYNDITFTVTNNKYQLVDYANSKGRTSTGYLIWLYENKGFTLYKKQNISFTNARAAKSGFDKDIPASFDRAKDTYFLKDKDKRIYEFPSNRKDLFKLFPEKKSELEAFIKQSNIDLEKQADLFKVVDFLSL